MELLIVIVICIVIAVLSKSAEKRGIESDLHRKYNDDVAELHSKTKSIRPSTLEGQEPFFIYAYQVEDSKWIKVGLTRHCSRSRMENYERRHRFRADYDTLYEAWIGNSGYRPEEFEQLVHLRLLEMDFQKVDLRWSTWAQELFVSSYQDFSGNLQAVQAAIDHVLRTEGNGSVKMSPGPKMAKHSSEGERISREENYEMLRGHNQGITNDDLYGTGLEGALVRGKAFREKMGQGFREMEQKIAEIDEKRTETYGVVIATNGELAEREKAIKQRMRLRALERQEAEMEQAVKSRMRLANLERQEQAMLLGTSPKRKPAIREPKKPCKK